MRRRQYWLTRCSVKQTRILMFPRQVCSIFGDIRLTQWPEVKQRSICLLVSHGMHFYYSYHDIL
ncbi:hypothetical protein BCR37DRAFT_380686, partial [Protomyces lactucae-debilis]